ncbi:MULTISPECIES: hypothetical protein [Moorena]|uniref:hypothetical protein n=1 Tax=Moorena TaxID=1155738 RepID=UPI0013756B1B|nr:MULTISPECIES: hypothetical protein [Moorena]NES46397.1 hypothetical protein [Moorena sp. SIO2C4]
MANLITGQTHHYGLGEAAPPKGVPPMTALPWFPPLALGIKTTGKHWNNAELL